MKKMFFLASLLLAAATLNSCSQDCDLSADEAATAAAGALTPEQRAQVMELAEYYGLDVSWDESVQVKRGAVQAFNVDSVEDYFRFIASLRGTYVTNKEDIGRLRLPQQKRIGLRRLAMTVQEESVSDDYVDIPVSATGGRWVDLTVMKTGLGVDITAMYHGQSLSVTEVFATLFPNGDFNGSYWFLVPSESYFPVVTIHLSVTIQNGVMTVTSY